MKLIIIILGILISNIVFANQESNGDVEVINLKALLKAFLCASSVSAKVPSTSKMTPSSLQECLIFMLNSDL